MARERGARTEYAPFDDDYRGFEIREEESARGPLILALAIGVLLVFGAVVWNTYRQGVRSSGGAIPSVLADSQPYKRLPDERGGTTVRDTEKRFYDQMDASDRDDADLAVEVAEDTSGDVLQGGPPIELRPGLALDSDPENGMPNAVADQVKALADLGKPDADDQDLVEMSSVTPVPMPRVTPVPRPPEPDTQFAFSEDGEFLVQVAAFRSEEAAESAWKKASQGNPDLYRGAGKRIQRADLGAKGVFYRLRIGAFNEKSEASAFCDALKATGDNCIVVSG